MRLQTGPEIAESRKNGGDTILRFDDTNPEAESQECAAFNPFTTPAPGTTPARLAAMRQRSRARRKGLE